MSRNIFLTLEVEDNLRKKMNFFAWHTKIRQKCIFSIVYTAIINNTCFYVHLNFKSI
jgi:hypothetical protein